MEDMQRINWQRNDGMVLNSNNVKRQKLQYEIITIDRKKSFLEDLANEIFYDIFEYLDMYHIYKGFFNLNRRFENLIINSNFLHQTNISMIPKNDLEDFHINVIIPNRHRINSLRLSNPFVTPIIFSSPRILLQFIHLKQLVLDNIQMKYLRKIFDCLMHSPLPKLYSLSISIIDCIESLDILFVDLFNLSTLKYCKLKYETKTYEISSFLNVIKSNSSPIEYLIINGRFPFIALNNLLCCLPQLHYLSINCLADSVGYIGRNKLSPIQLNYLKYVSLKLDCIRFYQVEEIFKNFFHYIHTLRLTTHNDENYLNAKQWEELIISYMPCLRIFDINHTNSVNYDTSRYRKLINGFNSSFWIEKKWLFTYQHDWSKAYGNLLFYSTDPYRRKDYKFLWDGDAKECSHIQESNLNSIQHILIYSYQIKNNDLIYLPNITQITIKHYPRQPNGSITTSLDSMIQLKQVKKLIIQCHDFPFEELIKLLSFTLNLHTLKLKLISLNENNIRLIQQSENFQYVSKTNQVKHLDLFQLCEFNQIELIINLFPQLEYLKTGINYKEIQQITRYLLSKTSNKAQHLFFLCISGIPKVFLKKLNVLIKSENLLHDYCIRFINRDLFLWW
ncbi:unnamed protein product [Rotaria socialis]